MSYYSRGRGLGGFYNGPARVQQAANSRGGLGFSLKPPSWLRNIVKGVTGAITTPGGTVVARDTTGQITVTPGSAAVNPGAQFQAGMNAVPGGAMTLVALGLGALMLMRGRR